MPATTKNELRRLYTNHAHADKIHMRNGSREIQFKNKLTVLVLIKTILEIIKVKKIQSMDKETKKQFPEIAKEIVFLAEQTQ